MRQTRNLAIQQGLVSTKSLALLCLPRGEYEIQLMIEHIEQRIHKAAKALLNLMRLEILVGLLLFAWVFWLEFGS